MYIRHMRDFAQTLSALRSFVDFVGPFLRSNMEEVGKRRSKDLLPVALLINESYPDLIKDTGISIDKIRDQLSGVVEVSKDEENNSASLRFHGENALERAQSVVIAVDEFKASHQRVDLLYRSALVS